MECNDWDSQFHLIGGLMTDAGDGGLRWTWLYSASDIEAFNWSPLQPNDEGDGSFIFLECRNYFRWFDAAAESANDHFTYVCEADIL